MCTVLRSINPSSYLFFFDYGDFKIFGLHKRKLLSKIVGWNSTHSRNFQANGWRWKDADLAKQLSEDQKENSEHVMLVDLARNLSRNGHDVQVEKYREVQFFACDSFGFKSNGFTWKATTMCCCWYLPAGTLSMHQNTWSHAIDWGIRKPIVIFYGAIGFMDLKVTLTML
jgi:anthranilate synthase component 1